MEKLTTLYRHRFSEADREAKLKIWEVLCRDWFQRFVPGDATVLDLASGYGEFSQNIKCGRLVAVDLNPEAGDMLPIHAEFHLQSATNLSEISDASIDLVFTSNFLEHLPTKTDLDKVFAEVLRVLKQGGRFMIMGPNIRYVPGEYWDFYDHYLPLTHLSLQEGLLQAGFRVERLIDRFLPYTTQSALPTHPALIALYLRVPLAWRILGKQFFCLATKPPAKHHPLPAEAPPAVADLASL